MATAEQIAALRLLIDEPTQTPYPDVTLSLRLDAAASVDSLAGEIWREKAARFAGLVDVREGNSDRKLSQLYSHALEVASSFDARTVVATSGRTRTRRIERP